MERPAGNVLIAVYESASEAAAVAEEVRGLPGHFDVRVDDAHDRVDSLRAEMREEVEHTWLSPQAGFVFTKEMTKSLLVLVPLGAVLGALVTVPLVWLAFRPDSTGAGIIWALVIGAVMGGTIATIVGASLGARGPADQSAAHVGVPVRVSGPTEESVVRVLAAHAPLRLDLISADGKPIGTLLTEEDQTPEGIVQHLRHQFTQDPHGDWRSSRVDNLPKLQEVNIEMQHALNEDEQRVAGGTTTDSAQTSEAEKS